MKYRLLIVGVAVLLASVISQQANAVVISTPILSSTDLGTLDYGDAGSTPQTNNTGTLPTFVYDIASGFIPANSKITFKYSLSGIAPGASLLVSMGSYDYELGGHRYTGSATATSGSAPTGVGFVDGASSAQLVFASANLSPDLSGGITTITNLSKGLVNFTMQFIGSLLPAGTTLASYSVSAVPLPAALPLFGFGLAGLAGVSRFRRSRKSV